MVKVDGQADAQHAGRPAGDIAVALEIKEDLQTDKERTAGRCRRVPESVRIVYGTEV